MRRHFAKIAVALACVLVGAVVYAQGGGGPENTKLQQFLGGSWNKTGIVDNGAMVWSGGANGFRPTTASAIMQGPFDKDLLPTTATVTTFCAIANLATDSSAGCTIVWTVQVADASHHVGVARGSCRATVVNQNGTCSAGSIQADTPSVNTGGTFTNLTAVVTATVSGSGVYFQIDPTWSAGTPTSAHIKFDVISDSQATPQ